MGGWVGGWVCQEKVQHFAATCYHHTGSIGFKSTQQPLIHTPFLCTSKVAVFAFVSRVKGRPFLIIQGIQPKARAQQHALRTTTLSQRLIKVSGRGMAKIIKICPLVKLIPFQTNIAGAQMCSVGNPPPMVSFKGIPRLIPILILSLSHQQATEENETIFISAKKMV